MVPAWPVILLLSLWFTFVGPLVSGPYLLADRFELDGVTNQVRAGTQGLPAAYRLGVGKKRA